MSNRFSSSSRKEEISYQRWYDEIQRAKEFYRMIGLSGDTLERCAYGEVESRFQLEPIGG